MYFCSQCKVSGHSVERCFKLHGYPPGFKHKKFTVCVQDEEPKSNKNNLGITTEQLHNLLILINKQQELITDSLSLDLEDSCYSTHLVGKFCFLSKIVTSRWIVDSGVVAHMCNSLDSFISTHKITNPKHSITIPDGRKVMVDLYGDVAFMDGIILTNVLYVPDFQFNILSLYKLCTDMNSTIVFANDKCFLQDPSKTRLLGRLANVLYYAAISHFPSQHLQQKSLCVAAQPSTQTTKTDELVKLWHLRLGQILFSYIDVNKVHNSTVCTICPSSTKISLCC